jgi:hypothetical protein
MISVHIGWPSYWYKVGQGPASVEIIVTTKLVKITGLWDVSGRYSLVYATSVFRMSILSFLPKTLIKI